MYGVVCDVLCGGVCGAGRNTAGYMCFSGCVRRPPPPSCGRVMCCVAVRKMVGKSAALLKTLRAKKKDLEARERVNEACVVCTRVGDGVVHRTAPCVRAHVRMRVVTACTCGCAPCAPVLVPRHCCCCIPASAGPPLLLHVVFVRMHVCVCGRV